VHGYHTKVPPKAVLRFLLHYTKPGDVVLDAFCGSGMVGLAGHLAAAPPTKLKDELNREFRHPDGSGPEWGQRLVVLADLSPAATFIANSYNNPTSFGVALDGAASALERVEKRLGWIYETSVDGRKGKIEYAIWSDVFACPQCATEFSFWEIAVDVANGKVRSEFDCPSCTRRLSKRSLDRVWNTYFDSGVQAIQRVPKQSLVRLNYSIVGATGRDDKLPNEADMELVNKIEETASSDWYPTSELPPGEKTPEAIRLGMKHVHQLFTRRNLLALSALWAELPEGARWLATGAMHRASKQHQIAISRIGGPKKGVGGATAGHRRGTLYVPSNQVEMNVFNLIRTRIAAVRRARYKGGRRPLISTGSATSLPLSDESVDYVFTDPPFGANIMYSELSFMWEAWLDCFTNAENEAIQSRVHGKGLDDYRGLMKRCFAEYYRVLRPGRWMTVEFSNTKAAVWNAIQTALEQAGFVVANVGILSKGRGGLNAIVGRTAVNQDLAVSCYKPSGGASGSAVEQEDAAKPVWRFVHEHLSNLPVFRSVDGEAVRIDERSPRSLFDRLVAYCVARSISVPISSREFQEGLHQRFPEREEMYFLPTQVSEYDRKRRSVAELRQLTFFVDDERTAIQWVRQRLHGKPQSYQDLAPPFMREIQDWASHEATAELADILNQGFLCYDGRGPVPGQIHSYLSSNFKDLRNLDKEDERLKEKARDRWYVPDPNKQADLDGLRDRSLLKEFEEYETTKQRKLKVFRTEAVRAGFKAAWQARAYRTIVQVSNRLPDDVLQEDATLLMYYDNALTRLGDG